MIDIRFFKEGNNIEDANNIIQIPQAASLPQSYDDMTHETIFQCQINVMHNNS
mgnify:CR=1 FL=1